MLCTSLSRAGVVAVWLLACGGIVQAQNYPNRPVHLVVPNPAGGGTDAYARILAKGLEQTLGQPVIVENRPGQGTSIGGAAVSRAAPDGYTLLLATSSTLAINVSLYKKLPYDPLKDFTPISLVAAVPFVVVVHPSLQVASLEELIALAKRKPGELSYASAGVGSVHHIFAEKLKALAGIDIKHVPYRGGGPALIDVVAGHVPIMFADAGQATPYIKAGHLKALGVTVGTRLETLPDVPTLNEAGAPGYDASDWQCVVGPAGLPAPIVAKLNTAIGEVVAAPETKAFLLARGMQGLTSTPTELESYVRKEIPRWAEVVTAAGASAD
jgi:tripartite-type tricarboxylate transporter receptor subunit TctC